MTGLPRVAIGTIQPGYNAQPVVWALLEALRRNGIQVQSFLSRACFPDYDGAAAVTGLTPRHLDSWLMSPEMCSDAFRRGVEAADFAVVEGQFSPAVHCGIGGSLETLCHWLDLPRLAVIDAAQLEPCRLPARPDVDGLLLDGVSGDAHRARLTTELETLWGIAVLGSLDRQPALRARLDSLPKGSRPPPDLCRRLGDDLLRHWRPIRLAELACCRLPTSLSSKCRCRQPSRPLTIAVAYDEVFHYYFPDTLDSLEARGASIVDFSPLRDEHLPPGADIVYFGCGHPELHAGALAENHCIKSAIRGHLRCGRRIYAEGGGLAYLCQELETPEGDQVRMVGLVPAKARLTAAPISPQPVEITVAQSTWLGERGTRLRGYHNSTWELEPHAPLVSLALEPEFRYDLVGSYQFVGSLFHFNFAAQPEFLERFFSPYRPLLEAAEASLPPGS
ncbi:MAG: hypothetical protein KJZ87_05190 [Thermoguttaceae bacterium]|nr:hypothetical protein [Thermoguttaceae bacterium]